MVNPENENIKNKYITKSEMKIQLKNIWWNIYPKMMKYNITDKQNIRKTYIWPKNKYNQNPKTKISTEKKSNNKNINRE